MLQPFGFELREAKNGREAVDICSEWNPHLVWMDMRMPVMDGYEATKRIRDLCSGAESPVIIAVTASVFEEDRTVVMSIGCDGIVMKPYKEIDIIEVLQKHLDVKFIYSVEEMLTKDSRLSGAAISDIDPSKVEKLTSSSLDALPEETVTLLKKAVAALEIDTVLAIIEEIAKENQPLAMVLKSFAEEYRFDKLQKFLEQGK